jgi:hypothetical protein
MKKKRFKYKIRTAKSLRKILDKKPSNDIERKYYYYLWGIYDSRLFGLCIYKVPASIEFLYEHFVKNSKDIDPEFNDIVNDNFYDLI